MGLCAGGDFRIRRAKAEEGRPASNLVSSSHPAPMSMVGPAVNRSQT
jgi:hypothetical protein